MRTACMLVVALAVAATAVAAQYKPGDMATVKTDKAEVKQGSTVIATLPKGTRVKIHWVHAEGGHALIYVSIRGKGVKAYIKLADLEPKEAKEAPVKGTGYRADDRVVVQATSAKLMKGKTVLGRVAKGTVLAVIKVKGDWIGLKPKIDGKEVFGWIHSRDLDYAPTDGT